MKTRIETRAITRGITPMYMSMSMFLSLEIYIPLGMKMGMKGEEENPLYKKVLKGEKIPFQNYFSFLEIIVPRRKVAMKGKSNIWRFERGKYRYFFR